MKKTRDPILPTFNYVDDILPYLLMAIHTVNIELSGRKPWWINPIKWDAFYNAQKSKFLSGQECLSRRFYEPYLNRHFAVVLVFGFLMGFICLSAPLIAGLLGIKILADFGYMSTEWAEGTGREIYKYLALYGSPIAGLIGMIIWWRRRWRRVLELRSIYRFNEDEGIDLFSFVDRRDTDQTTQLALPPPNNRKLSKLLAVANDPRTNKNEREVAIKAIQRILDKSQ